MSMVNMLEAKSNLSRLVETVENGAKIVIARNGRPAARLVSIQTVRKGQRTGVAKGLFTVPDDIDEDNAPIEAMFNGQTE